MSFELKRQIQSHIKETVSKFYDREQEYRVSLVLKDNAVATGIDFNPLIAKDKDLDTAVQYGLKQGWIKLDDCTMNKEHTWLDRVKLEQAELQIKLDALSLTLNVPKRPEAIPESQWVLMSRQQFNMRQYNQILKDRIADASPDTNLAVRIDDTGIIGGFGLHLENLAPSITTDKVYIKPSLCGSEDQI